MEAASIITAADDDAPGIAWDDDGTAFDPETGEVLAPEEVLARSGGEMPREGALDFAIVDRADAEEALATRAEIEARLVALKARRAALVANLDRQVRAEERRLAWWDYRFFSGVVGVARSLLKGRSKTAAFDHGKVAFRACPPRHEINDDAAALAWARVYAPRAIKVKEWVTATDVVKARAELEAEAGERVPLAFLVEHEPREAVSIKTGVES